MKMILTYRINLTSRIYTKPVVAEGEKDHVLKFLLAKFAFDKL